MRRWQWLILLPIIAVSSVMAQDIGHTRHVSIKALYAGLNNVGYVYASMIDNQHLLIEITADCRKDKNTCWPDKYFVTDLDGSLLAKRDVSSPYKIYLLLDGRFLEESKNKLELLDINLSPISTYNCKSADCGDRFSYSHVPQKVCLQDSPDSCHLIGSQREFPSEVFSKYDRKPSLSPLLQRARDLKATEAVLITPNEVWYMDQKYNIYQLLSGAEPKLIGDKIWFSLDKDSGCNMELSVGSNPRILASCETEGIKIDYDDGIGLLGQIAVFDVHTHKMILRRTVGYGSRYSLSPDGTTLIHVRQKAKMMDLELLP